MSKLMAYDYPGNIRELKAIVQAALNLSRGGSIAANTLPADVGRLKTHSGFADRRNNVAPMVSLAEMEKEHIRQAFKETNGNLTRCARLLGISLNTLRRKQLVYGIDRK
jgi:DNA-binding NtrC family response regulator